MKKLYTSIAYWPDEADCPSITSDKHYTFNEAANVCNMLNKLGYGGDGKIYPTKTEVKGEH